MKLSENFKVFSTVFKFFYFFGQDTVLVKMSDASIEKGIFIYLPSFFFIIVFVILTPITVSLQIEYKIFLAPSRAVMNCTFLTAIFSCSVTAYFQTFCAPKHLQRLLSKLNIILVHLRRQLQLDFKFPEFQRKFCIKCVCLFLSWFITFVVRMTITNQTVAYKLFFCWSFASFMKNVTNMHAVFFIDLLHCTYKTLNSHCDAMPYDIFTRIISPNRNTYIGILRHYKYVHYKLSRSASIINEYFGWILCILCIVDFLEASYSVYFMFLFRAGANQHLIIRN